MHDRGSISLLFAGMALMLVTAGAGAVRVGEATVLRQKAQAAADAVALAAALHPGDAGAAQLIADAHGARITSTTVGPGWVEVTIERRGATARARAQASGGGALAGLDPRIVTALRRAERITGRPIPIMSGYRSAEEQRRLWDSRASNLYPVAYPGTSQHERGLAVDLAPADAALVVSLQVGLCRPFANDPVHLELCADG